MVLQKNSLVLTMVLIIVSFACACGKKDSVEDESFAAYMEEVPFTETTKTGEKEATKQWEKGYDLPIDEWEIDEAENDCSAMMERIYEIYNEADKGTASNVVLADEIIFHTQIWEIMKAWILSLKIVQPGKAVLW